MRLAAVAVGAALAALAARLAAAALTSAEPGAAEPAAAEPAAESRTRRYAHDEICTLAAIIALRETKPRYVSRVAPGQLQDIDAAARCRFSQQIRSLAAGERREVLVQALLPTDQFLGLLPIQIGLNRGPPGCERGSFQSRPDAQHARGTHW